ncbi:hypothetical protein DVA86_10595 [Streptomyces armeniacus]|uniref:DUF4333 domain-containing protein n=1 Tax=Streptomyces armeniacus TaxID=83291 RepID=A0A345XN14_9ACTN|nr:hypothetical protein [Streptomyces armeniacus]AXK33030.1 hypothetical protein DVA86_10595 [Streptomyces armeniacus]
MSERRTRAVAVLVAAAALTFTAACGGGGGNGGGGSETKSADSCRKEIRKEVDRAEKDPDGPVSDATPAPCRGFRNAELEDMAKDILADALKDAGGDGGPGEPGEPGEDKNLAAGVEAEKTAEYAIDNRYGKKVRVTVMRTSDDAALTLEDPGWTGTIE